MLGRLVACLSVKPWWKTASATWEKLIVARKKPNGFLPSTPPAAHLIRNFLPPPPPHLHLSPPPTGWRTRAYKRNIPQRASKKVNVSWSPRGGVARKVMTKQKKNDAKKKNYKGIGSTGSVRLRNKFVIERIRNLVETDELLPTLKINQIRDIHHLKRPHFSLSLSVIKTISFRVLPLQSSLYTTHLI